MLGVTHGAEMVQEIAQEFWREYVRAHPISATLLGYRELDDRMPDVTPVSRIVAPSVSNA